MMFGVVVVLTSCEKEKSDIKDIEADLKDVVSDLMLREGGDYERVITKRLIKPDDCRFIVSGTIQLIKGNRVIATIDFGDGRCDNIATKTVDGVTTRFYLDRLGGDGKDDYTKVIVEPIVKLDDCDFIVAGIIDYYYGDKWVARIDYGDGRCDNIAMKYWDGGQKEIILQ
jgi:hypothetical protein